VERILTILVTGERPSLGGGDLREEKRERAHRNVEMGSCRGNRCRRNKTEVPSRIREKEGVMDDDRDDKASEGGGLVGR